MCVCVCVCVCVCLTNPMPRLECDTMSISSQSTVEFSFSRNSPCGVIANMPDSGIVLKDFEHQSCYYGHNFILSLGNT